MGPFPARIVAQDFVTPPEFASLQLASVGAGRVGGTSLRLEQRAGQTRLVHRYEQIPIRVAPLYFGAAEPALIYLINPTAGLFDGDAHRFAIAAGPGTRTLIVGQSASRMHPCRRGFCTQQWDVTVEEDAVLAVLPGPAIPFAGTRLFQRVRIHLDRNARLAWGDIWFAGRYACAEASERFRFECIVQDLQVERLGQMTFRDRFAWHGPWDAATARWHFGPYPAVGSVLVSPAPSPYPSRDGAAVFATAAGDRYSRVVGTSDDVVRQVVQDCLTWSAEGTDHQWLVASHHLAAVHWFDVS